MGLLLLSEKLFVTFSEMIFYLGPCNQFCHKLTSYDIPILLPASSGKKFTLTFSPNTTPWNLLITKLRSRIVMWCLLFFQTFGVNRIKVWFSTWSNETRIKETDSLVAGLYSYKKNSCRVTWLATSYPVLAFFLLSDVLQVF